MILDDYLAAWGARRFAWSKSDCIQVGLCWARERTGRHLSASFAYATRNEADAALRARGGLRPVLEAWMTANGFPRTDDPQDGDIGLAEIPRFDEDQIAGAAVVIRYGPWWVGKAPKGICSIPATGIPAWRVL